MKKKTIIGFVTFTVILLLAAGVYVLKHNKKEALTVINYGELGNISMDNDVQNYWNTNMDHPLAASERGYYYVTMENMLIYFEIESGDYIPVCAKPECTHDTLECNAYLGKYMVFSNIYYYNGYIYYMPLSSGMATLCRIDPSGTSREVIGELLPSDWSNSIHLTFQGDYAYSYNWGTHQYSEDEYVESIIQINLNSGETKTVYEIEGKGLGISNVKSFGDKVFFIVQETETSDDKTTLKSHGIYCYNSKDDKVTQVIDSDVNDYYMIDDDVYYFVNYEGVYRTNIESHENMLIYPAQDTYNWCELSSDGKYIYINNIKNIWRSHDREKAGYIVLDREGSYVNELKCPYALMMYFGDDKYIFYQGMGKDQIMYLSKEDITGEYEWKNIFEGGVDMINWRTEMGKNK